MITNKKFQQILSSLPLFQHADPELVREFQNSAYIATIPAGRDVFIEGDYPESIALVL